MSSVSSVVHLVRHGEVYNPNKVLYGRLPGYHLSERGVHMAAHVAGVFAQRSREGARVGYLAASPLTRAQETAAPIATALGLAIGTEPDVLEAGNTFEGSRAEAKTFFAPKNLPLLLNPAKPSWGESYRDQVERMVRAVHHARQRAIEAEGEGAEAILVSHQLPIWVTRRHFSKKPLWHDPRRRECNLASITTLEFSGDDVVNVRYEDPAVNITA